MSLASYRDLGARASQPVREGRLQQVVGLVLEASGCSAAVGDTYTLQTGPGRPDIEAEVVGLRGQRTLLMPLGGTQGLRIGTPLRRTGHAAYIPVGPALLGRVIDARGEVLDGEPPPRCQSEWPLYGPSVNPLQRRPVEERFPMGVRAIDGMLTVGEGQRLGIFAGAGVGKSTLLGMLVRSAQADVVVVGLIGERSREVQEFVTRTLGPEALQRAVVVAATSSDPPLLRMRGALYATAVAEYFRSQGLRVLLLMDSLTRFAMAMRDIGLAAGEPATTKGYTPGVFGALPQLLERAGNSTGPGGITALYTVLVEGDDMNDPIADAARSILDGHIVLSRKLAERGHFPSIDMLASLSRLQTQLSSPEQQRCVHQVRDWMAAHHEAEDLLSMGLYKPGALPRLDQALARMPAIERFLRQGADSPSSPEETWRELQMLCAPAEAL